MAGVSPSGGPFEKQPIQQQNPGVESRDEKRLDEDSSSPTASVDDEAGPVRSSHQLGSTEDHVFSEPSAADYWRKVYEQAGYENRHRFDPSFQWTAEEEKKLIRKVRCAPLPVHPPLETQRLTFRGTRADRLAHHALGMGHVCVSRHSPKEHQPRHLRQHGPSATRCVQEGGARLTAIAA